MKKIIVASVLSLGVLASTAEAVPVQTPVQKKATPLPNIFRTLGDCGAAMSSGRFRFYEPKYLSDHKKNPVNGNNRVEVLLPEDMCVPLFTVVGCRVVVQREGTKYRANKLPDGSLELYARDDCGNATCGKVVLPPPQPASTPTPVPSRSPSRPIAPRIIQALPSPTPTPTPEPTPVPTPIPDDQPSATLSTSQWGFTASGMVGEFDSIPIGGDGGLIESIAGRRVCVKGRTIDLGFARGGIAQSLWRFTFVSKSFTKGSFTEYKCTNCTQEVRMVEDGNVRTLGFQIERVQGFNNKTWGSIRPMISVNAGIGSISGSVRRLSGPVGKPPTKSEMVHARELFGSGWVANAGVGVGIMGDLGKKFTYAVTVIGVEYPGSYYGRVSLTYWP
jgi:hypothetical protein